MNEGKPLLLGPYQTEEKATEVAMLKFTGDYEVIPLPTRNEARATRMVKAHKLSDNTLVEATKDISHNRDSLDTHRKVSL